MPRSDQRTHDQLREVKFFTDVAPHATGSVLISFGNTRVICAATIQDEVPRWMKMQNVPGGWLTAEYSMLPYSTLDRKDRDISRGKLDGRSPGNPASHWAQFACRGRSAKTRPAHALD